MLLEPPNYKKLRKKKKNSLALLSFDRCGIGIVTYIGTVPYVLLVIMQEPPFIVGRPVTGEYFVDREDELRRLQTLVKGIQKGASSN